MTDKKILSSETIDTEPTWCQLLPALVNMKNKDHAIKELKKVCVIADMVRQAEKRKDKLVFDFRPDKAFKEEEKTTEKEETYNYDDGHDISPIKEASR
ncbi:MAG: hypothetical protein GY861_17345 [bacterium]|nr:hypothetical protein [bacterium]